MPWPTVDIAATGVLGIAFESTSGTYVAPTKFFAIENETLAFQQTNVKRRTLKGVSDIIGVVAGSSSIKGEVSFEMQEDVLVYFLRASRLTMTKSGTTNYLYTFTPFHGAIPLKTLSITVVRNGMAFGYSGCVVEGIEFDTSSDGVVKVKATILGIDEASVSVPTATWNTTTPYGPGSYQILMPNGTADVSLDKMTFTVTEGAKEQFRLDNSRKANYITFGERAVSFKAEKDFMSRTEYDTYFKGVTASSCLISMQQPGTTYNISSFTSVTGNVAVFVIASGTPTVGSVVTVSGCSISAFNATGTITAVAGTSISVTYPVAPTGTPTLSSATMYATPNYVNLTLPSVVPDTMTAGALSSQSELIRSSLTYDGVYNSTAGYSYQYTVGTTENIS